MSDINICEGRDTLAPQQNLSSRVLAAKLSALILDLVHSIDIVDQLIQSDSASSRDWLWQRQLRFYVADNNSQLSSKDLHLEPRVQMVDAEFRYTFEYQGNPARLVHTPLTDKCYITLTQSMRMGLGGNPYGPAGTGKTESVKALGGLMGRQVSLDPAPPHESLGVSGELVHNERITIFPPRCLSSTVMKVLTFDPWDVFWSGL